MLDFSMDEYTLTASQLYYAAFVFSAVLVITTLIGVSVFGNEPKKMAWVISLLNSGLMTGCGIYYILNGVMKVPNFWAMPAENLNMFEDRDNFTVLICLWFALANIFDIAVGIVFYRKYLGLLTAYVHHSVFIYIMYAAITGHTLIAQGKPFARAFSVVLIEELPTFLLALGSVIPALRTDIGFGSTFFLFRLCYHVFFFYYGLTVGVQAIEIGMFTLTTLLHAHWFYNWVTKYGSKPAKDKSESRKSL